MMESKYSFEKEIQPELLNKLISESVSELKGIMDVSVSQRAKDIVKSALGRSVRTKDPLFWPAGMLMLSLMEARRVISAGFYQEKEGFNIKTTDIDDCIGSHLLLWREKHGGRIEYIDDALAGAALIKLYCVTEDQNLKRECKEAADRIYEYLLSAPRDSEGTIVYNAERNKCNVFADGVGQCAIFLSAYGKAFGEERAVELAKLILFNFKKNGMDEKSHLPYHGYAIENGVSEKKGILSWGRAAGWLIMGLSEYVSLYGGGDNADSGHSDEEELSGWYRELSDTLLGYTKKDGGFAWQVQAVDGHIDISATGMILYGILGGVRTGNNSAPDSVICDSIRAISGNIVEGKVINALSSCDDFGVHYQTYGQYPWGQGAALMALAVAAGFSG